MKKKDIKIRWCSICIETSLSWHELPYNISLRFIHRNGKDVSCTSMGLPSLFKEVGLLENTDREFYIKVYIPA